MSLRLRLNANPSLNPAEKALTVTPLSPLKTLIEPHLSMHVPKPVVGWSLAAIALSLLLLALAPYVRTPLRFIWNCFVKPLTKGDAPEQKDRLDSFYAGQADVYDTTRTHLLKGRETMLQLLASHLKAQPVPSSSTEMSKPKIWVDIGGGTGWNIEKM